MERFDVTIIGGGTTGMYATFYSGLRELKTKLVEASSDFGGKVALFYPDKYIYDIGGIPGVLGDKIVEQTLKQADTYKPTIIQNEWIEHVVKQSDGTFLLIGTSGKKHLSKTIILATGNGRFTNVAPALLDPIKDQNVTALVKELEQYKDKNVAIFSNNKTGIDWALELSDVAKQVYLFNDKVNFQKAKQSDIAHLENSNVRVSTEVTIEEVVREQSIVKELIVSDKDSVRKHKTIDAILLNNGLNLQAVPFEKWGLETDKGRIVADTRMATNVEGVFVSGDAASYPGKTMLIASGYTEAVTAVNSAKKYLDPKASEQVYSTVIYRDKK
ncbi:NAD(P)/FAD-dependent oxidoreductase [Paraliobacillus zengyii]|uniref:NAD(P)/FAD-dependent oxidoreductase n=1 Tax=Paraliobacillus zengyii TaxID=2213194 RepID=UPI0013006894|nr:NAD(P)/FAD-dependent oxidoreductase [Paraliobacillus zengyii]